MHLVPSMDRVVKMTKAVLGALKATCNFRRKWLMWRRRASTLRPVQNGRWRRNCLIPSNLPQAVSGVDVTTGITLGNQGRVHGDTQTGEGVREDLFPEEGPMQPSFASLTCFSPCSILVLSGEAESGSAGTQPDKE